MNVRLVYVSQWFTPEPAGPGTWIPEGLSKSSFDVCVLTAVPNYPEGKTYSGYRPYRFLMERINEILTLRSPVYPSHDRSAIRRALNYASFAASASWFGRKLLREADIALVYSSPATAAIPVVISNKMHGVPYVLLIQDLWPDTVLQTGMINSRFIAKTAEFFLNALDRTSTKNASRIFVISPGMKRALIGRGVPDEKVTVLYNWVDDSLVVPRSRTEKLRRELGIPEGDLLFMYAGNHGSAQGLSSWIEAIRRCQDLENLHFVFMGSGTEKKLLQLQAQDAGIKRVYFIEPLPLNDFVIQSADADAQIISLKDSPLFSMTIPGKVQTCLAQGNAVIGSLTGDAATLLLESGAGIIGNPEDSVSIEKVIRQASSEGSQGLKSRGMQGRDFYISKLSSDMGISTLSQVLRENARPCKS